MPIIPELSPTAGDNADGFADCVVQETLLTAELETQARCSDLTVYRLDRTNGSVELVNDTANATSGVPNQWKPFGTSAQFTDGDEFLIGCGEEIQALLFRVNTAAAHSGTLKVYDSTDGVWATNQLTVTDEGNAFKSTGWHYITIPDNANRKTWRPSLDPVMNIPAMKYIRLRLEGIVGGNTPPQGSEIVGIRKDFRFEDHTDIVNGNTATAPAEDKHYPWTGAAKMWCFANPAYRMEVYMHLIQTHVITDTHEYLAADDTWKALSGWQNATDDFTIGPSVLGNPVQKLPIAWSIPADWASKSVTVTLDDGTSLTKTGYWIRERTTGVTAYGEHINPRYRLRARQFGNANVTGQQIFGAKTLQGVNIMSMTNKNTSAVNCEVVNLTTGKSTSFTIPGNPALPQNFDVVDLAFANGDRRGIRCVSGGSATGVQIEYAY